MKISWEKLALSGGIAGALTPYLLSLIVVPLLNLLGNYVPSFSLKLATPEVAINIRHSLVGINGGLAAYLMTVFGFAAPEGMMMTVVMSAAGGALLFVLGGYAADALGILEGSAVKKTAMVVFIGSIGAALILGKLAVPTALSALNITLVNVILAFMVNAAIIAYVFGLIDEKAKIGLTVG